MGPVKGSGLVGGPVKWKWGSGRAMRVVLVGGGVQVAVKARAGVCDGVA